MMSEKRAQKFNTDDASQPRSLKPHVLICRFFISVLAFENAPYFAFRVLLLLYHLIAEYLSGSLFRRNGAVILSLKIGISMRMCKVLPDTSNFFFVIAHEQTIDSSVPTNISKTLFVGVNLLGHHFLRLITYLLALSLEKEIIDSRKAWKNC